MKRKRLLPGFELGFAESICCTTKLSSHISKVGPEQVWETLTYPIRAKFTIYLYEKLHLYTEAISIRLSNNELIFNSQMSRRWTLALVHNTLPRSQTLLSPPPRTNGAPDLLLYRPILARFLLISFGANTCNRFLCFFIFFYISLRRRPRNSAFFNHL